MKATPDMRKVRFSFRDRVLLIPSELILSAKYALFAAFLFLLLSGIGSGIYSFNRVTTYGITSAIMFLSVFIIGTVLPPVLLPWLPGRAFSIKGTWVGLILILGSVWYSRYHPEVFPSMLKLAGWIFIIPAVTSFIAMNFTGSTTYTSLSGVRKEIKIAMPIQISTILIGMGLLIAGGFV